jgi:hypothetical protein
MYPRFLTDALLSRHRVSYMFTRHVPSMAAEMMASSPYTLSYTWYPSACTYYDLKSRRLPHSRPVSMAQRRTRPHPPDEARSSRSKRHRADRAFASAIISSGHTSGTSSFTDFTASSGASSRRLAPRFSIPVARPALPVLSQPPVGARWDFEETSRPADDHSGVKYVVTDARDNSVS